MRPVQSLVHSRARIRQRYALFPLEGYPMSRLPTWPDANVRVLASPAMGAGFVQYLIDLPRDSVGKFAADGKTETFHFVLHGEGEVVAGHSPARPLTPGGFGLTPGQEDLEITADTALSLLVLRKRFEPAGGFEKAIGHFGHEKDVTKAVWADNPHSLLQTLIPDDFAFDMAMNIFTFDPGFGLPYVETHVMEHGLYFLEGKGLYYLDRDWLEVQKDDFIWMGPYCPQSFCATGPTPSRYLYYKNVNREIQL